LSNIGAFDILHKLYSRVTITPEIAQEFEDTLPLWIDIVSANDAKEQQLLELQLDKGEASAITLALEMEDCLLIIDDAKGRRIAVSLGLKITGTLGVLVNAKKNGIVRSVKPWVEKLISANFRVSDELRTEVLKECGEL
jgi:predicted nucleic acid-binding protein